MEHGTNNPEPHSDTQAGDRPVDRASYPEGPAAQVGAGADRRGDQAAARPLRRRSRVQAAGGAPVQADRDLGGRDLSGAAGQRASGHIQDRPSATRRLLTVQEAAVVLGLSIASVRRMIWDGRLPVLRITRRIQIDVRDLDRLIGQSKERPGFA